MQVEKSCILQLNPGKSKSTGKRWRRLSGTLCFLLYPSPRPICPKEAVMRPRAAETCGMVNSQLLLSLQSQIALEGKAKHLKKSKLSLPETITVFG
ncbi:hypothetical protein PoB_005180800 [Plakobranchus ocellatus]|uniref:Uncharacterized protein n=1 Tax=Plakobranchus ocellatus TaxID=259542 RepID=A0AAV4C2T3_9GAST|nr:hypothetical protein PoB_005180800 [Plakobranchus ocellatus]